MSAVIEDLAAARAVGERLADAPSEPQPLPAELLPVEAFPLRALPEAFRPWVSDVAERMQCPPDFIAVPMLVAAASLVARHVGIRPQARTDWVEPGNLWALIVGRPGVMKSPAMAQALAPIERLEARAASDFNDQMAGHRAECMAAKLRTEARTKAARAKLKKDGTADVRELLREGGDDADAPERERYIVSDATYEKLGEILAGNPGGVLSVRDEMRGLFSHLAREESAPARAFYLQAWSGGRYTFDRIGRGTVTVQDARLSMIGGIQPGPLAEMMLQARRGSGDDGMIERFVVAWPDPAGDWREVDRWPESDARRAAWDAFDRLDALTADALHAERDTDAHGEAKGLPYLRFADDAREAFTEWRAELERRLRDTDAEGLEGALSKFRHHVPALALTLHVVDGGVGPVALAPTARALALAEYFESHAKRLHASGRRMTLRAARAVLGKAQAGALPDPFTARDVYRPQWAGLTDRATVADALDMLAAHGWLTEANAETGGAPDPHLQPERRGAPWVSGLTGSRRSRKKKTLCTPTKALSKLTKGGFCQFWQCPRRGAQRNSRPQRTIAQPPNPGPTGCRRPTPMPRMPNPGTTQPAADSRPAWRCSCAAASTPRTPTTWPKRCTCATCRPTTACCALSVGT